MQRENFFKIARYAVVGILTLLFYIVIGYALRRADFSIFVISMVAFSVAIMVNYILQKSWVFSDSRGVSESLPKYLIMTIVGYYINYISLLKLTTKFSFLLAQTVAILLVTISNAAFSFFWTFRKNKR